MRLIIFILFTVIIGFACGPKSTESIAGGPRLISVSGQVYLYEAIADEPLEDVWVVIGQSDSSGYIWLRTDSVKTDSLGSFAFENVHSGEIIYELYLEPRIDCFGAVDSVTFNNNVSNLIWRFTLRPNCL